MEASAPSHAGVEAEPAHWQPRATWLGARFLCGSISFFFASFVFAYFYLDALDVNHNWKIQPVHTSKGLGIAIMALFVLGAIIYRLAAKRPEVDEIAGGIIAVVLSLLAIALQFFEYTQLDFGAASGGYAAVFFGWTSLYAIVALFGMYWIETQVAQMWRLRRRGLHNTDMPTDEVVLLQAGIE